MYIVYWTGRFGGKERDGDGVVLYGIEWEAKFLQRHQYIPYSGKLRLFSLWDGKKKWHGRKA